ncbi:MAG: acyl-CoA thioesterase [Syntrophales bacterium]
MEDLMKGYPVVIEIPVAWGEMDSNQHVNNSAYFRYFESARIAYFERTDIFDQLAKTGIGRILAATSCEFKMPLKYPDRVLAGAKVMSLGEDRFTMGYRIVSVTHRKIVAEGDGVIVTFDYRKNRKVRIPDDWRMWIEDLEGRVK